MFKSYSKILLWYRFRITFKHFNYCILGLTHRKYILTVTGYNNQIRTM